MLIIYIPTNSVQGFPFPHILANVYYLSLFFKMVVILANVRWYLIVVLTSDD